MNKNPNADLRRYITQKMEALKHELEAQGCKVKVSVEKFSVDITIDVIADDIRGETKS